MDIGLTKIVFVPFIMKEMDCSLGTETDTLVITCMGSMEMVRGLVPPTRTVCGEAEILKFPIALKATPVRDSTPSSVPLTNIANSCGTISSGSCMLSDAVSPTPIVRGFKAYVGLILSILSKKMSRDTFPVGVVLN